MQILRQQYTRTCQCGRTLLRLTIDIMYPDYESVGQQPNIVYPPYTSCTICGNSVDIQKPEQ
jgi:hypothetical protein